MSPEAAKRTQVKSQEGRISCSVAYTMNHHLVILDFRLTSLHLQN